ncbi:hypothetical protein DYBT9275_05008 [Dyadobacter sp. CECT 9275]|uniref:Uncharacterized protein n=1 Tax=Dyadobacter helix TaxID=2822344 RepID=A0A916N6X6_9BACT|nr:hypothetical protein [Dyadobacter sp. CECT 9275]CAG5011716.1 hypothetical protein DYBT9275_05008 [Dyadobacter sp. CECT 9275]
MEIHDELEIEIFHTLEKIRRTEEMIRAHVNAGTEEIIINQYQALKTELSQQLAELLSNAINAKIQIAA